MTRIDDKITEIEKFLDQLKDIIPDSIKEYRSNIEKKAACERFVEKIVEATTDLAFLMIKIKKFRIPEDDADAFNILSEHKIIDDKLSAKLKQAKGMRNILSHQYGQIDDEIIFDSINNELGKDIGTFIKILKKK